MNKLKIGLLCFIICSSFYGFGQLTDFNLSKYKLPDLQRRALESNFNISGYNNFSEDQEGEEGGSNQYNGYINLNYNYFLNNSTYQRKSNLGLSFSSSFSNDKGSNESHYKSHYISPLLSYQLENRKYYKGLSFFENNLVFNYRYGKNLFQLSNSLYGNEFKNNLQTHTLSVYAPLKFGFGRVEPVQDARHAIYILDELSKEGRVSAHKSDEQIIEFAKLISQLKNKRFFDSRLRRMYEIEMIDSFMVSNNYVSKQDAKYFTTLADFWDYGNRPFRNSGTRFSFALLPGYYYYDYNRSTNNYYSAEGKFSLSTLLFDGGIELKHEKPVNLFWQNSIDLNFYAGLIAGKLNDKYYSVENKIRIPNIRLGFNQTIGFYPNTRTDLSFRYSVQYVQLFDKTDFQNETLGAEGKGAKFATDLVINYYISPKFRLSFSSSFYYIWQDSTDKVVINFDNVAGSGFLINNSIYNSNEYSNLFKVKEFVNNFRVSLVYSIF